jgi:hypothetical protein
MAVVAAARISGPIPAVLELGGSILVGHGSILQQLVRDVKSTVDNGVY